MSKLNIESGPPSGSQIWLAPKTTCHYDNCPGSSCMFEQPPLQANDSGKLDSELPRFQWPAIYQVKLDLEVAGKPVHEKHWKSGIVKASSTKLTALAVFCAALEHRGSHWRHTWSKTSLHKIARPSLRCSGKGPERRNALNIESGSPNGPRMSRSMQIRRFLPFFLPGLG